MLLSLKVEVEVTMQAASRKKKRKGVDSPLELLKAAQPCQHPDFNSVQIQHKFLTSGTRIS
jgi:hypothetical protein